MICRLLYAHKSLFGSDGYGFAGYSRDAGPTLRRKTEALLHRLGYDERLLQHSQAYFWLNLDANTKILGKVTLRQARGKSTLYYQTIIVSTDFLEGTPDGPFLFSGEFQDGSAWVPGEESELPVPRVAPSGKTEGGSPSMWTMIALPFALIRGFENDVLRRWYGGLSTRDKQHATFVVPQSPLASIERYRSATCHFAAHTDNTPSQSRYLPPSKALVLVFAACAGIGFVVGMLIWGGIGSETDRGVSTEQNQATAAPVKQDHHHQTIMVTAGQEQELVRLTRSMEGLANNLRGVDELASVLPQFRPAGEHPLADTFANLNRYIHRAQKVEAPVSERLNDVFYAIGEFERILSVRRNLDANTGQMLERVNEARRLLSDMQTSLQRPLGQSQTEAERQDILGELDAAILQLKQALEITSAAKVDAEAN